jgi:hypothetical protein
VAEAAHVTLTVDKEVQLTGHPVTLTWTSNVEPCQFIFGYNGDGWTGAAPSANGSMTVTETHAADYTYRVMCGSGPVLTGIADAYVTYSDYPAPTLTVNKTTAPLGSAVTLTWASPDNSTCIAAGGDLNDGWTGNRAASGSVDVTANYSTGYIYYFIKCGPSPQVRVKVLFYRPPAVTLNASLPTVTAGDSFLLTWNASDTNTCVASGGSQGDGWGGSLSGPGYGSLTIKETATGTYTYTVNCLGGADSTASAHVTVTVNAAAPPPPPPPPPSNGGTSSSSSGGGGGGGAMGPIEIGFCFSIGLLAWHRRQKLNRTPKLYRRP